MLRLMKPHCNSPGDIYQARPVLKQQIIDTSHQFWWNRVPTFFEASAMQEAQGEQKIPRVVNNMDTKDESTQGQIVMAGDMISIDGVDPALAAKMHIANDVCSSSFPASKSLTDKERGDQPSRFHKLPPQIVLSEWLRVSGNSLS